MSNLGSVSAALTLLPGLGETTLAIPLGVTATPAGNVGIGCAGGQLLFQIYGSEPALIALDLHDLARAIATKLSAVRGYSPEMGQ